MKLPSPLTSGHLCADCNGTGADASKTDKALQTGRIDKGSHIRCNPCNGNGLNPAAYFRPYNAAYKP